MTYTNWDAVEVIQLKPEEKGLIAKRDIPAGEIIGVYDGEVQRFRLKDGMLTDRDAHKYIVQLAVEGDILFGLYKKETRSGIGFINHSCKANVVPKDRVILVADRPIPAGEALTVDYAKWDFIHEGIRCWCPEPNCII